MTKRERELVVAGRLYDPNIHVLSALYERVSC